MIICGCYEQLHFYKFETIQDMNKFLNATMVAQGKLENTTTLNKYGITLCYSPWCFHWLDMNMTAVKKLINDFLKITDTLITKMFISETW